MATGAGAAAFFSGTVTAGKLVVLAGWPTPRMKYAEAPITRRSKTAPKPISHLGTPLCASAGRLGTTGFGTGVGAAVGVSGDGRAASGWAVLVIKCERSVGAASCGDAGWASGGVSAGAVTVFVQLGWVAGCDSPAGDWAGELQGLSRGEVDGG